MEQDSFFAPSVALLASRGLGSWSVLHVRVASTSVTPYLSIKLVRGGSSERSVFEHLLKRVRCFVLVGVDCCCSSRNSNHSLGSRGGT